MNEPIHIREILPAVMSDIEKRRQARVMSAVGDFLGGKKKRPREHRAEKKKAETLNLW